MGRENLAAYRRHLEESEGIGFEDWRFSSGCVPLETGLVRRGLVLQALQEGVEGEVVMRRVEFVGPQVGEELTEQGILAVVYALIGIFLYVMVRFQWRFSVGAVVAIVHDIIVTLGILSILQVDFDLTVVAAILKRLTRQVPTLFAATQDALERERLQHAFTPTKTQFQRLEWALAQTSGDDR